MILRTLLVVSLIGAFATVAHAEGDPKKGEKVFKKCKACHMVGEGAKNRVGPPLNDLFGRKAGTVEGFKYSKAMKEAGEKGLVWDVKTLDEFLKKPKAVIKKTRMAFVGLKKEKDRANVIAYLKQFSKKAE